MGPACWRPMGAAALAVALAAPRTRQGLAHAVIADTLGGRLNAKHGLDLH